MILTASEVQQLTGKARAHAQVAELKHLGIPYKQRRDGSIIVVTKVLEGVQKKEKEKQDNYCPIAAESYARLHKALAELKIHPVEVLRELPEVSDESDCGIYFLWYLDELMYIGQSVEIPRRVGKHSETKLFDRATWLAVPSEALNRYERDYVGHYHPPLNRTNHG